MLGIVGLNTLLVASIGLSGCSELAAQVSDRSDAVLQLEITVNQQALSESRVQIDSALTNAEGGYSLNLPKGNYVLLQKK